MYDKPVGQFGKASQCEWVGAPPGEDVFVIPRQQSMYAVDFKLLTFLTDSLNFSASNFSASVKVWLGEHQEPWQKALIAGEDHTMYRNTRQWLEDTWFVWKATSLAKGTDKGIIWRFTDEALEENLVAYAPLVRRQHVLEVIAHIPGCPRCSDKLVLVLDGKMGAWRRVCANMDGFWTMPEIGVFLNSGCQRQAAPGRLR